jgi:hypothetical protein
MPESGGISAGLWLKDSPGAGGAPLQLDQFGFLAEFSIGIEIAKEERAWAATISVPACGVDRRV